AVDELARHDRVSRVVGEEAGQRHVALGETVTRVHQVQAQNADDRASGAKRHTYRAEDRSLLGNEPGELLHVHGGGEKHGRSALRPPGRPRGARPPRGAGARPAAAAPAARNVSSAGLLDADDHAPISSGASEFDRALAGSVNPKVEPAPGTLSTHTLPPCAS